MAEKRMFSKMITESDAFLDLPLSTQALYFHLCMYADDDGFLSGYRKIMRMVGASQNEYDILLAKRFLLEFDDGIVLIKHWLMHNYLRKDRYTPSVYTTEKSMVFIKANKSYTLDEYKGIPAIECSKKPVGIPSGAPDGIPVVDVDKSSIDKSSKEKSKRFKPPTSDEVHTYCKERNNNVNAESFVDFYASKGWMVGKNKMKDWKAAVRQWERRDGGNQKQSTGVKINRNAPIRNG